VEKHDASRMGQPESAVIVNIQRQPGANIISVVDRVKKILPQLQAALPASVNVQTLTDRTATIRASVEDVQFELMLTVALVVMVIFLFLRSIRATIIPSVAVPLSIVGHVRRDVSARFSFEQPFLDGADHFHRFVVDDAIVMIENISRYIEEGESPLQAALKGSEQIGFTILSLNRFTDRRTHSAFVHGDIVGPPLPRIRHHARVTILVSAVVSLTLTPMMSAKLLRHQKEEEQTWFYRKSEHAFNSIIAFYWPHAKKSFCNIARQRFSSRSRRSSHDSSLYLRPQRIFPRSGHRRHSRHL